jgi:hypothetical protein
MVSSLQVFQPKYCTHIYILTKWTKILDFHGGDDSIRVLHPEDRGSMELWNFGILPHHYTAS